MTFHSTLSVAIAVGPTWFILKSDQIAAMEKVDALPFDFTLKNLASKKGKCYYNDNFTKVKIIWADLLRNNKGWLLCSERFKTLIDTYLKGGECLKWISCYVNHGEERRLYYIPLFMKELDVLDMEKSLYYEVENNHERILLKPVFSQIKIQAYSIFNVPINSSSHWRLDYGAYVSEELRKAIRDSGMVGMVFELVAVSN